MKKSIAVASLTLILCSLRAVAAEPTIWFCPMDPLPRPEVGYSGSPHYMDLFTPDAPWQKAAARVQVFKIYPQWIGRASDADLQREFADLKRRNIALALEAGVLTLPHGPPGIEGFGGDRLLDMMKRIQRDGGTLSYVGMDEPIFFGSVYDGPNKFQWTVDEAVTNAAKNIQAVQAMFPGVKFGDIEPVLGKNPLGTYAALFARYRNGFRAFKKAGIPLAFFDADLDWNASDFPANLVAIHGIVKAEDLPFGIIYDGDPQDKSDAAWIASAERHQIAAEKNVIPDIVIFQSWHAYPKKLLPESDADSFTGMIERYAPTKK